MNTSRNCPVCDSGPERAAVFLEENIDRSRLNEFSYSSRKEPEFMNHGFARCTTCDLVYVVRPPKEDELAQAYHAADYDSAEEANDAATAYGRAIEPVLSGLSRRDSALEIGTGTGAFLEHLATTGFSELVGIEPSRAAISAAPAHRRAWLRESMFAEADFSPDSFDLICCFMTMEHVRDPLAIGRAAMRLLRPGGAFVIVTHDYRSAVNRVLGRRSPIIDVEHMQLFSAASSRFLFESCGFADITVERFVNSYSLRYWVRLLPLPRQIKHGAGRLLAATGLGEKKLGFNVGNSMTAGFKRVGAGDAPG